MERKEKKEKEKVKERMMRRKRKKEERRKDRRSKQERKEKDKRVLKYLHSAVAASSPVFNPIRFLFCPLNRMRGS